jgi:RNA polymerase sigma-70 factor (ECF subfamily)
VTRYQSVAHRTAVLLAGAADADDAVQDALLKAHRALGRFRPDAPFRPWLLRIVANEALNRRRSAGRRRSLALRSATLTTADAATPDAQAIDHADRERLLENVQALPERLRVVVTCRYFLDLSERETAEVLGWPAGSVKSRLSRALTRLRETVVEEEHV